MTSHSVTVSLSSIWTLCPYLPEMESILKCTGKEKPDDEQVSYEKIVEAIGLNSLKFCSVTNPKYANLWRTYAIWCLRPFIGEFGPRAVQVIHILEKFIEGVATDLDLEDNHVDNWHHCALWASGWARSRLAHTTTPSGIVDFAKWSDSVRKIESIQKRALTELVTTGRITLEAPAPASTQKPTK